MATKDSGKKMNSKKSAQSDTPEEVITEEVKITKKLTKDVKGKTEDSSPKMVSLEVEEVLPKSKETDEASFMSETGEAGTAEPNEVGQSEEEDAVIEQNSGESVSSEDESDQHTSSNESEEEDRSEGGGGSSTGRATVYGDDFDAVQVEKKFSVSRLLLFILIIVTSAAIFFTGMILYTSNRDDFKPLSIKIPFLTTPTPTPTAMPSPTPTPTPAIDTSDYSVEVLNGSGVTGAAGAIAGLLEDEGFEDVAVGNADASDYEDTEVQMTSAVPSGVFDIIAKALSDYTVVEGDELDSDSEYDIVITVGQQNTTTPTPTEE